MRNNKQQVETVLISSSEHRGVRAHVHPSPGSDPGMTILLRRDEVVVNLSNRVSRDEGVRDPGYPGEDPAREISGDGKDFCVCILDQILLLTVSSKFQETIVSA